METRNPPYSEEGEKGAIGAMLMDPGNVVPDMQGKQMTPEDFYVPAHRLLAATMAEMFATGRATDSLTVADKLRERGQLEQVGGVMGIAKLMDSCATPTHAGYYLGLVKATAVRRRIIQTAREVEQEAYATEEGEKLLMTVPTRFAEMATRTAEQSESNEVLMTESIGRWRLATGNRGKLVGGLELPWGAATELTCGLEVGLTILAGRPSAGKTTMEDMIACYTASKGMAVGRSTLDSSRQELLERALCRKANVSMPKLKFGFEGEGAFTELECQKKTLASYPMYISDRFRDVMSIASWARATKLKHDIKLLTVDFIQLVRAPELGWAQYDDVKKIAHCAEMLKALSFELKIPVLLLAQLNRAVEKDDRDPMMSDLKGCGGLEEYAHKVIFLYRDNKKANEMEAAQPKSTLTRRPIWFDCVKNKNGETYRIPMWMQAHYFRFVEAQLDPPFADDMLRVEMDPAEVAVAEEAEKMAAAQQAKKAKAELSRGVTEADQELGAEFGG